MPKKLAQRPRDKVIRRAGIRQKGSTKAPVRARARRLDPTVRRELILDSAARVVVERGISSCTLEAVGDAAGVSKALVYNYFDSREALFGALLTREFDRISGRHSNLWPPEGSFEDALRTHTARYLEYLTERGALMRALTHDVGVMEQVQAKSRLERREILDFWINVTMEKFGVPPDLARLGCIMVIAAEEAAEGTLRRGKVPVDRAADFWTTFTLGGWTAVAKKFA